MTRNEYHEFPCLNCIIKVIVETEYSEEYAEYVDVKCPKCKRYIGQVKSDNGNGYGILGTQKIEGIVSL